MAPGGTPGVDSRTMLLSAERLPASLAQRFNDTFGVMPLEGYGVLVATMLAGTPAVSSIAYLRNAAAWSEEPLELGADEIVVPEIRLDEDAGLADWLCAARETAEEVKSADHRSRAALYRALSRAYDFAIAAQRDPDDYAELLEESGVKAQARAPMTPIVKLVFGIDYDKTRLTEFAAALANAQRNAVPESGFLTFIEGQPGGLKALVAAERQARRPEPKPDTRGDAARDALRALQPIALGSLGGNDEFVLVIARRDADGGYQAIASVDDAAMLDRAIRRSAS